MLPRWWIFAKSGHPAQELSIVGAIDFVAVLQCDQAANYFFHLCPFTEMIIFSTA